MIYLALKSNTCWFIFLILLLILFKFLINYIVNAIEQRFSQPSFTAYEKMESLLLKGINGESYIAELDYMKVTTMTTSILTR